MKLSRPHLGYRNCLIFPKVFYVTLCQMQGVGAGALHFCRGLSRSWSSHLNSDGAGVGATLQWDSSQLQIFSLAYRFSLSLFLV